MTSFLESHASSLCVPSSYLESLLHIYLPLSLLKIASSYLSYAIFIRVITPF